MIDIFRADGGSDKMFELIGQKGCPPDALG